MKKLLIFLLLIFTSSKSFGADYTASFDQKIYNLSLVNEDEIYSINEYIPPDQELKSWNKMIALYRYHNQKNVSPQEFANNLGLLAKQINPEANFEVIVNNAKNEAIIDLFTWTNEPSLIREFIIFKFKNDPATGELIGYQYAFRGYGKLTDEYTNELKNNRIRLRNLMLTTEFPKFVKKTEFKN
jgi:hypothetical protein